MISRSLCLNSTRERQLSWDAPLSFYLVHAGTSPSPSPHDPEYKISGYRKWTICHRWERMGCCRSLGLHTPITLASPGAPFDDSIDSLGDFKKQQQLQGLSGVLLEKTYSLIIDSDTLTCYRFKSSLLQCDNLFDILPSILVSPLSLSNHNHVFRASCANLVFVLLFFSPESSSLSSFSCCTLWLLSQILYLHVCWCKNHQIIGEKLGWVNPISHKQITVSSHSSVYWIAGIILELQ